MDERSARVEGSISLELLLKQEDRTGSVMGDRKRRYLDLMREPDREVAMQKAWSEANRGKMPSSWEVVQNGISSTTERVSAWQSRPLHLLAGAKTSLGLLSAHPKSSSGAPKHPLA